MSSIPKKYKRQKLGVLGCYSGTIQHIKVSKNNVIQVIKQKKIK